MIRLESQGDYSKLWDYSRGHSGTRYFLIFTVTSVQFQTDIIVFLPCSRVEAKVA